MSPPNSGHAVPIRPRVVREKPKTQHEFVERTSSLKVCTRSGFRQRDSRITNKSTIFEVIQSGVGVGTKHSRQATRDLLERFPIGQNALSCMRQVRADDQHSARQQPDSHPTYPRCTDLRVLSHVGPHQNCWTPEPPLWTMTWRVHNVTSWDTQVFQTFEGFLQTHHMPGDAVPEFTDETAKARFTHACRVPTRDGERGVDPPSPRLRILALSQMVSRTEGLVLARRSTHAHT